MNGEQARKDNVTLSSKTTLTASKTNAEPNAGMEVPDGLTINALNQNMKKGNDNLVSNFDDAETILELGSYADKAKIDKGYAYKAFELIGLIGSVLWVAYSAVYFMTSGASFDPAILGGMLTGVFAPVAIYWLCFSHVMRKKDVEFYAQNLRGELEGLLFPSKKHATKVNKDIQLLCQQVADMNNNSRAALKSIQRARHGLRNEIRDFSSVASKAEFHIDRLGDVLEARKTGLMESIGEIEIQENVLKDHAKSGLDAWRSAEAGILGISQDVETKLQNGVERINGAAEQAHDKVCSIDETMQSTYQSMQSAVDNFGVRLDGLSSDFDGHVEALSASADRVSGETEKLGGHIRGEVDSLEKMTIQAIEAMAESSMSIEAQRLELSNGVERLSVEAKDLASRIEGAAGNMDETVAVAVARSIEIEERMAKQADRIDDVSHMLDEKASNLEKSSDHMASQLGDAMSVAVSGAEKLRSAVRRVSEEMEKTSQQTAEKADELLDKVSVKFENLHDHSAHNIAKIRNAANGFDDVIIRLDKSVEQNGTMIASNVTMLDDKRIDIEKTCKDFTLQISELVERFDDPLSDIIDAGQELELRQEKVSKILENRTADLSDAGERAQGQAEKIRDILGVQVQDLSTLSGELSGHSAGLEDRVRRQREQLNEYLGAMMEKVDAHGEAVDGYLSKLKGTNEDITFNIDRFEEDMDELNASIHSKAAESKKTLGDMEETYFEHWNRVESHSTKSAKRLESAIDVLKHSSQETLPVYDEVLEKVDRAENRFKELNLGFVNLSDDSLERMKKLRERLEETAMNMDASVSESGKSLRMHEDGLRDAALLIDESAESATLKLKGVESRLNDQENNIRLIADKMEIRIDGLNDTVGQQFIGLTESVGQAVAQLSDAASRFDMIASKVTQNADESSAAITLANEKAIANLDNLLEAGQRCTSENEKAIQILDKKTSKLLGTTKESRDAISRAGDSFVIRAREFEEHIKASLTTTKDYVIELRTQANAVAEASDEGADQIRFSITDMKGQMDQITKSATDVSKKISDSGAKLEEEGDKLNMRARSATSVSEAAAGELARQSHNLAKSVRDSETALERISDMRKQAQQEAFMDSAKFIVESLHSLSVDITRQVKDGEVDDKTWKAFKKGDVSAFTRSLVNIDLDKGTDKLQSKFEKDNAFRSYTLRFIRQFEEILDHAYATSHADILCAAFLSSDLGKLYQSLCVISGRQMKKNIH